VSPDSDRCLECVKHKKTQCDVWGPTTQQWAVLEREEQKLEVEWEATQESQRVLQEQILESQRKLLEHLSQSQAKLQRLDKQRKLLKTRAAEMMRRGLKSLDELDALEQKEKEEAEKQSQAGPVSISSNEVPVDPSFLSDSFWEGLDFVDGTRQATPSS
jgi:superfamily II RNA helicase